MYLRIPPKGSSTDCAAALGRSLNEDYWQGSIGLGQPVLPRVSGFTFRNTGTTSGANCCEACSTRLPQTGGRLNLGVGLRGGGAVALRAANGMELIVTLAGHQAGNEYDILRTRRNSFWQRVAGAWNRLESDPMGTNDDHGHIDECLVPRGNRIFVEDRPGWVGIAVPAAAGQVFQGVTGVAAAGAATELVFRASFAEWVNVRNRADGVPWTRLELPPFANGTPRRHIYWHSITWLVRNPAGDPTGTWVLGPRSRIRLGSLSGAVIHAAPA